MNEFDIVIIGSGIAALTVAEELKKENQFLSICIVSDEEILPYYRLKLSSYLFKEIDSRFFIKPREWFSQNNIKVFLRSPVINIDFRKSFIETKDKEIFYKTAVIASGAKPFMFEDIIEKEAKDKVFYFRSYSDLVGLKKILHNVSSITIVGAGLLGLELADELKNKDIFLIEMAPRLLPKQLDPLGSIFLEEFISRNNIKLTLNSKIEKIEKYDTKLRICLSSGKAILSDIMIFSAGVLPNLNFIKEGIKTKRGILVDSRMQTNMQNVFACGDVANFQDFNPETWNFAIESARVVAKNILGKGFEWRKKEYPYYLKTFGIEIVSVGNYYLQHDDLDIYEFIDKNNFVYKKLLIKEKKLVGYILINDLKSHNELYNLYMKEIDLRLLDKIVK